MLVLAGIQGERFFIKTPEGREVIISIELIKSGQKIRLGFVGDDDVQFDREIVHHSKERERLGK